jgi:glycosyltransferase involved in cell wall biosynthesis
MKKILFILPSYNIGGINTSLMNFLSVLKDTNLDISMFVCNPSGELKERYRDYKILPQNHLYSILLPFSKKDNLFWNIFKLIIRSVFKLFRVVNIELVPLIYKLAANQLSKGNYNVVIALQEGPVTQFASYFKADVLAAWIHCMYERYFEEMGRKSESKIYSKFDRVVSVSHAACQSFSSCYPQFTNKTVCIYNCIDNNAVRLMAKDDRIISSDFKTDVFTIISLGRIDPVKQFSKIPEIARKLMDMDCKLRWYILGGIADKEENQRLINNILKFKVEDNVVMLGATANPYAYIAKSNLVVCTSKSESFNYTISEAKVLHVPVVTTDFDSVKEFIQDNVVGFISPLDQIHLSICKLISNATLYNNIKNNINDFNYPNEKVIDAFINLINFKRKN